MSVEINGNTYYRTAEVCRIVGISRSTLFRWLRDGLFTDVKNVDRRGWRLFTEDEIARLKAEVNQIRPNASNNGGN
jgi:predicted site-specific integrase-resolvase